MAGRDIFAKFELSMFLVLGLKARKGQTERQTDEQQRITRHVTGWLHNNEVIKAVVTVITLF